MALVSRLFVGLAAGAAGSLAMNAYARLAGHDRLGHGMQPPQSAGAPDDDAAARAGAGAYEWIEGTRPSRREQRHLGRAAHYVFGSAMGGGYALCRPAFTGRGLLAGMGYGAVVWAVADEGVMPALQLSRGPRQLPWHVHLYSLAGHLLYGAVVAAVVDSFAPSSRSENRRGHQSRKNSGPHATMS